MASTSTTTTQQSKILTQEPGAGKVTFTVTNYNVNRFWLCDDAEKLLEFNSEMSSDVADKFHWNNRVERIARAIGATGSSIVCLEEMRKMESSDENALFSCAELRDFEHEDFVANGTMLCMKQCILYDKKQWFCAGKGVKWLSSTPDVPSDDDGGFGRCVGYVKLMPVTEGRIFLAKNPLYVFVTHFSVFPETRKWKESEYLSNIVKQVAGTCPFVICGDFNFFDDAEGGLMRKTLSKLYCNVGAGARYSQSNEAAKRTYVPYSYEKRHKELVGINSTLDHIFVSRLQNIGDFPCSTATVFTETFLDEEPPELSSFDDMPSDHMPLRSRELFLVFKKE